MNLKTWKDEPDHTTPINRGELNKISMALFFLAGFQTEAELLAGGAPVIGSFVVISYTHIIDKKHYKWDNSATSGLLPTGHIGAGRWVELVTANVGAENSLEVISGVVRQTAKDGGWSILEDSGHTASGVDSVSVSANGDLVINHTPSATKVGSLSVSIDETFNLYGGLSLGGSVDKTSSVFNISIPLNMVINASTLSKVCVPFLDPDISITKTDGVITVNHSYVYNTIIPVVMTESLSFELDTIWLIDNITPTSFDAVPYSQFGMYLAWSGTDFTVTTDSKATVSIDTDGQVKITGIGATSKQSYGLFHASHRHGATNYAISVSFQDKNSFYFYLIKPDGSVLPKSGFTASTKIYVGGGISRTTNPTGFVRVQRAGAKVNANNLFGASANLWISGEMVK